MTEPLQTTVPAAAQPESLDNQMAWVRRLLEGHIDPATNIRHPGVIEMLAELYEEAKLKRERRETFWRAVASGGMLAILGIIGVWLKDHLKF